ncbi:MAG: glycosyltransferase family 1 protein [Myxococcaceae bacterium]|nr:MAG: glycosyltransferase family 1 protein [Myxococcaceae bacterium]
MKVVIDASNLRAGGGLTHLLSLLGAASPERHGITAVDVWSGRRTLDRLPSRPWLTPRHHPALDRSLPERLLWQRLELPRRVDRGLLFAPGGATASPVRPRVVMCRNMLPFEAVERARFGLTTTRARLELLRLAQSRQFTGADGVIFLTQYARDAILPQLATPPRRHTIIPHGVDDSMRLAPREPRPRAALTAADPLRLLYVSTVSPYKHFAAVADAAHSLRASGLPIAIDFVGPSDDRESARALAGRIEKYDPTGAYMTWRGGLSHADVAERYRRAEVFVYASSCENLPNILIEAMAAGLPIASSSRGPMPEVLGDAGLYFDPEDPAGLALRLRELAESHELRATLAQRAFERAADYRWDRCAEQTFAFLAEVLRGSQGER